MYESLRRRLLRFLRVPPEPHPPMGNPASLRVFRAGRKYYQLRMATWGLAQLVALAAFLFWTAIIFDVEEEAARLRVERAEAPASGSTGAAPTGNWIERFAAGIENAAENVTPKNPEDRPTTLGKWITGYKNFFVELALLLPGWTFPLVWVVKIVSFVIYLAQIPITYVLRRLDYEMRWYMVTDRSLRLRHGVWKVTESTMSFANIQQVVVKHGPVQHFLRLADVQVTSAGGAGNSGHRKHHKSGGEDMHLGVFRHVTNAPEIRDLILERLRLFRQAGLGEPEEERERVQAATTPAPAVDPVFVARQFLDEVKALRQSVTGPA